MFYIQPGEKNFGRREDFFERGQNELKPPDLNIPKGKKKYHIMEESVSLDFLLKLGGGPATTAAPAVTVHPNSGKPLKPAAESAKTLESYHAQNLSKIRE